MESDDLVLTRVLDAPRALVWNALTRPEHFMRWWGPAGFTSPACVMDFRVGGKYHWCMLGPKGDTFWTTGSFVDIAPLERIVCTHAFADGAGSIVPPSHYGIPGDEPAITTITFQLEDTGIGTRLTLTHTHVMGFQGVEEGWIQAFAKLADSMGSPFVVSRVFDAPRELVWKAFTEPERMARWWGPPGSKVGRYTMDFKPGGRYHFSMIFPQGGEMWGLFVYEEISPMDRLVYLHSFSDATGAIAPSPFGGPWPARLHTTLAFEETGNATTLTLRQFPLDASTEEEAAFTALFADMTGGWGGTFDRLDAFLSGQST